MKKINHEFAMTFPICVCVLVTQSCLILCDPVNCVAHQAALSMDFSRKEYWSGLPCPSPGDLPQPGIKPTSLIFPVWAGRLFTTSATWEALPNMFQNSRFPKGRQVLSINISFCSLDVVSHHYFLGNFFCISLVAGGGVLFTS